MKTNYGWAEFPITYRQNEMRALAQWVAAAQSGTVVGLPGCGRSALLSFLSRHPSVFQSYLPAGRGQVVIVSVDLQNLASMDLATFYRVLLRAFYHARKQADSEIQAEIIRLYQANLDKLDPFLPQSALHELLVLFEENRIRVVMVLNDFNRFLREAAPKIVDTLWGLRDNFQLGLCYIIGMPQEVAYLPDPGLLGKMYELFERNVCWVGAMTDQDARGMVARAAGIAGVDPQPDEVAAMLQLSGNFPALLELVFRWWERQSFRSAPEQWLPVLLEENNLRQRLARIWDGLTREEQFVLSELLRAQGQPTAVQDLVARQRLLLNRMAWKGVCRQTAQGWQVHGDLLTAYVREVGPSSRGRIWRDEESGEIYQGNSPVPDLTALESRMLVYFMENRGTLLKKTDLIAYLWPARRRKVIGSDLQQLIYRLRKKIDTIPPQYIITWKGPVGGYCFYPEGRPWGA